MVQKLSFDKIKKCMYNNYIGNNHKMVVKSLINNHSPLLKQNGYFLLPM